MIVYQCTEKIVSRSNSVHISREVQVYVLHRHYLSISAACCSALDAEHRSERRLSECKSSLFAYLVKALRKAYGNCGFALACGGRVYCSNKDKLSVGVVLYSLENALRQLCLVMAVGLKLVLRNAELCSDLGDPLHFCLFCNFNIR